MIQPKEKTEKRVAVQAHFTDVLYIEQAGLQSAAMEWANSVWCRTAVLHRGGRSSAFRCENPFNWCDVAPYSTPNSSFGAWIKERLNSKLIICGFGLYFWLTSS